MSVIFLATIKPAGCPFRRNSGAIQAQFRRNLGAIYTPRLHAAARFLENFYVRVVKLVDLLRGKIDLFSLDMLVNMLAAAGLRVRLQIEEARC